MHKFASRFFRKLNNSAPQMSESDLDAKMQAYFDHAPLAMTREEYNSINYTTPSNHPLSQKIREQLRKSLGHRLVLLDDEELRLQDDWSKQPSDIDSFFKERDELME